MKWHFLAVLQPRTARPPSGLESVEAQLHAHRHDAPANETECRSALERAFSHNGHDAPPRLEMLGRGEGFTLESSPFCSYARRGGVHALLAGEVGAWPGLDAVDAAHGAFLRGDAPLERDDAHYLLDFYDSFASNAPSDDAAVDVALDRLARVRGRFAFVIIDADRHHVYAARDADGAQPLWWGATDGGSLHFGTHVEDLEGCEPSATLFPAGSLFFSEREMLAFSPGERGWVMPGGEAPGRVASFVRSGEGGEGGWAPVRAIPRISSRGCVRGAVYVVDASATASAH